MDSVTAFKLHAAELERTFAELSAQAGGAESRSSTLLARARENLTEAESALAASDLRLFVDRAAIVRSFNRSQVIFDSILYPETAPEVGWAACLPHKDERWEVVDTALMRLYFDKFQGGQLCWFDYKPRKLNFCNAATGGELLPCLKSYILPPNKSLPGDVLGVFDQEAVSLITANTPDVLSMRLSTTCADMKLDAALDFHAGFGGHLKEANTGFSVELELEGEVPENSQYCIEWNYSMQSGELDGMNAYALKAVGGVEDGLHSLSVPLTLTKQHASGGLYGVRLIDGVGSLITDFRFSRPLNKIIIEPLLDEAGYQGSRLRLFCPAADLADAGKRCVLFVSIV